MLNFRVGFTLVVAVSDDVLISLTKPWSHPWITDHYVHTTINQTFPNLFRLYIFIFNLKLWLQPFRSLEMLGIPRPDF